MKNYLLPADICLPNFEKVDGTKWSVIACDQYTSQPKYWEEVKKLTKNSPTTLDLILPEAFLNKEDELLPVINENMKNYLLNILITYKDSLIYLERTQSDNRIRRGIIGKVDLEMYDYNKGSKTLIRATEGTVLERIPPRVNIRRGAQIELPHIMMLIDDPDKTCIEYIAKKSSNYKVAYDFELIKNSGHVKGYFINKEDFDAINGSLSNLIDKNLTLKKYNKNDSPLLFAVGDGNHSLASAKALYEEIKKEIGIEKALLHPSRYALCEVVNLHDSALDFEPIYRVLFNVDVDDFISKFENYCDKLNGSAKEQKIQLVFKNTVKSVIVKKPTTQLAVATVQNFLDEYIIENSNVSVDYIHGEETVKNLSNNDATLGILFDGMSKDMLFKTVICDGALPRKTFSMGHAQDKRFYLECRKIK